MIKFYGLCDGKIMENGKTNEFFLFLFRSVYFCSQKNSARVI